MKGEESCKCGFVNGKSSSDSFYEVGADVRDS